MISKEAAVYWTMVVAIAIFYTVLMFWGVRSMLWLAEWMGEFNFCYAIATLAGLRIFYEGFKADHKVMSKDHGKRGL